MNRPIFTKPAGDWESFGKADRVVDETTRPVAGDNLLIWFDDETIAQLKISRVSRTRGRVYFLDNGLELSVAFNHLRITYDRMGGYRWEYERDA